MTSSLGTKSIDVSKYGLIFSTFQSNLGVAGLTAVIIRDDLIGRHHPNTPSMFNYKTTYDYKSIFNTTPVFAVYSTGLYLNYLNNKGGIKYYED